jgi:hypothetical protein
MELIEKVKEVVKLVETIGLSDDSLKDLLLEVIEDDEDERLLQEDTVIQEGRAVSNKDIREAVSSVKSSKKSETSGMTWGELTRQGMESYLQKWWYSDPYRYDSPLDSSSTVQSIPEFKFSNITFVVDPSVPNCAHGFRHEDGSYICGKEKCDCFEKEKECKK